MPDRPSGMLGHLRPRQTKRESDELRRLSRLLAATAASARHTAIIDCIKAAQEAKNGRDLGTRLGTIEGEARRILLEANRLAGLKGEPRPIPSSEKPGLWLPPGTVRAATEEDA